MWVFWILLRTKNAHLGINGDPVSVACSSALFPPSFDRLSDRKWSGAGRAGKNSPKRKIASGQHLNLDLDLGILETSPRDPTKEDRPETSHYVGDKASSGSEVTQSGRWFRATRPDRFLLMTTSKAEAERTQTESTPAQYTRYLWARDNCPGDRSKEPVDCCLNWWFDGCDSGRGRRQQQVQTTTGRWTA